MDPHATYDQWLETKSSHVVVAHAHWLNLYEWIERGGAEPDWAVDQYEPERSAIQFYLWGYKQKLID